MTDSQYRPSNSALSQNPEVFIQKRAQAAFIIWMALTLCCAVFVFIPYFSVPAAVAQRSLSEVAEMNLVLIISAGMMAVSSLFLRYVVLSQTKRPKLTPDSNMNDLEKTIQYWFTFNIITWGINESIASLGMVSALNSGQADRAFPFAIAALALNLLMVPNLRAALTLAGYRTSS